MFGLGLCGVGWKLLRWGLRFLDGWFAFLQKNRSLLFYYVTILYIYCF